MIATIESRQLTDREISQERSKPALAYDAAAIQHHGAFARLNFPNGVAA